MIRINKAQELTDSEVFARKMKVADVCAAVSGIIADVRERGDEALKEYALRFDGAKLDSLEMSQKEIDDACAVVGSDFMGILERAAENIRDFHSRQKRESYVVTKAGGIVVGQRVIPLFRVGLYVPGGTAAYPSSVLMNCIPAKIAGVGETIMMTPPRRDGSVDPAILAAAKVAGADRIFRSGGAGAIAALAYGTQSVPAVDKITGPGNAFVAEAKRQVYGRVAIDMIAGPSEILVIADAKNDPRIVAADLLSQAEHDKNASAVLVTDSPILAKAVSAELERQIPLLPRAEIARASIDDNGRIIVTDDIPQAVEMANRIAPEHLELCVDDPFDWLDSVKNAGSVFLGRSCPEALGDYFAGTNHTLPTSGTARFSSPLSVDDFVKKSEFTYYTREALSRVKDDIAAFADREGLHAHARSVTERFERTDKQ